MELREAFAVYESAPQCRKEGVAAFAEKYIKRLCEHSTGDPDAAVRRTSRCWIFRNCCCFRKFVVRRRRGRFLGYDTQRAVYQTVPLPRMLIRIVIPSSPRTVSFILINDIVVIPGFANTEGLGFLKDLTDKETHAPQRHSALGAILFQLFDRFQLKDPSGRVFHKMRIFFAAMGTGFLVRQNGFATEGTFRCGGYKVIPFCLICSLLLRLFCTRIIADGFNIPVIES